MAEFTLRKSGGGSYLRGTDTLRGAVGVTSVEKAYATEWHIRTPVAEKTHANAWNIRTPVTEKTHITEWNVRTPVSEAYATAWNVAGPPAYVLVVHTTRWHVRTPVEEAYSTVWNTRKLVPEVDRVTAWNVRVAIPKTHVTEWNVRHVVTFSYHTEWAQYEYERDRLTYTFQPVQPGRVQYQHSFRRREAVS